MVVNRLLIEKLHHLINEAEFKTKFWLVGVDENQEAVPFAEMAFESVPESDDDDDVVWEETKPAFRYWRNSARRDPEAQLLSRRLNFKLHQRTGNNGADTATEISRAVRRLVVTGEDRKQNFERLFGPQWDVHLSAIWSKIRLEVLQEQHGAPPKAFSNFYDSDAPFYRPRKPNLSELKRLADMELARELLKKSRRDKKIRGECAPAHKICFIDTDFRKLR